MKGKTTKKLLSFVMAAGMVTTLMPLNVFATQVVTPVSSKADPTSLSVEYFGSTVYKWKENEANSATQALLSGETIYNPVNVKYSDVATQTTTSNSANRTNYYYEVDSTYYRVYYTRTTRSGTTTYTLYYNHGSQYPNWINSVTDGDTTIELYEKIEDNGFYFTNATLPSTAPGWSSWDSTDVNGVQRNQYMIYSGLAASKLSDSTNAPFNTDKVTAAPLFATNGTNEAYTEVYTGVQVPFVYNSTTGYYTMDSDQWAVYFEDGTGASGATLQIADKPASYYWNTHNVTGFAPFNAIDTSSVVEDAVTGGQGLSSSNTTQAYSISGSMQYGFGMTTSVNFKMTEDGKITVTNAEGVDEKQDIIFKFAGDDDVWVYVDGVLALDIGGTHDAVNGEINFRSGAVTLTTGYNRIGDYAKGNSYSTSLSQTNLYTALGTDLAAFAADGQHTLTIYYMDRGRGRTNCKIEFNLPQDDTLSVTKLVKDTKISDKSLNEIALSEEEKTALYNKDFTFTLYKNGGYVADASYTLMNASGVSLGKFTTGADGKFTLKAQQTAVFDVSLDGTRTYYVVEDKPSGDNEYYHDPTWLYSSNIDGADHKSGSSNAWTSDIYTVTGSKETPDSVSFTCTNQLGYEPSVKVVADDDVVVIDYNLPVTVDVLKNDEIVGDNPTLTIKEQGKLGSSVVKEVTTNEGKAVGEITYTLNKVISEVDTVEYTVTATDTEDKNTKASADAKLSVVPASNVYYEDDFITDEDTGTVGIEYSGSWSTAGDSDGGEQSSDNIRYGYDEEFANEYGYSNGTAAKLSNSATASFTFKGTGVDIYSTTSSDAAYIYAFLYEVQQDGSKKLLKYALVDDYADRGTYYAVPTVTFENLDYADEAGNVKEYNVLLRVVAKSQDAMTYYLDGIRVYNPLGTVNDVESTEGKAYAAAGELNAMYTEIRSLLLDGSAAYDTDENSGIVFIDQTDDGEFEFSTYVKDGPKHEVYLDKGDGIAFKLTNFEGDDRVYVAIKSVMGGEGTVELTNGTGKSSVTINSSADQYYKITPDAEGNVVITNTTDTVIALTKVRTTTPDNHLIDFNTVNQEVLDYFPELENKDYYTDGETIDEDNEDNDSSGEVVVNPGDESENPSTDEDKDPFRVLLDWFFGWIRRRRP